MLDFIVKMLYNISMITIDDIKRLELPELTPIQIRRINNAETSCKNATCLLYTSPSPRDRTRSRMPSSA